VSLLGHHVLSGGHYAGQSKPHTEEREHVHSGYLLARQERSPGLQQAAITTFTCTCVVGLAAHKCSHVHRPTRSKCGLEQSGYDVLGGYMSPVNDAYGKPGLIAARHRVCMSQVATAGMIQPHSATACPPLPRVSQGGDVHPMIIDEGKPVTT